MTSQLDEPGVSVSSPEPADPAPTMAAPGVEPLAAPEVYVEPDVGQPLVESFLHADDWTMQSQRDFLQAWTKPRNSATRPTAMSNCSNCMRWRSVWA